MREILFARKKTQKRAALQSIVVSDNTAQHGIALLERVEYRALSDSAFDFERDLAADVGQISQMEWKYDADHDFFL